MLGHFKQRLVHALIDHAAERMVWATNWPHPGQTDPPSLDDLRRLAFAWMPDDAVRNRILIDNPAELYQFETIPLSASTDPQEPHVR